MAEQDIKIKKVMRKLTSMEELTKEEIREVILGIRDDQVSSVQIGGFQVALLMKGQTVTEIAAIANAMRDVAIPLKPRVEGELVDTWAREGDCPPLISPQPRPLQPPPVDLKWQNMAHTLFRTSQGVLTLLQL